MRNIINNYGLSRSQLKKLENRFELRSVALINLTGDHEVIDAWVPFTAREFDDLRGGGLPLHRPISVGMRVMVYHMGSIDSWELGVVKRAGDNWQVLISSGVLCKPNTTKIVRCCEPYEDLTDDQARVIIEAADRLYMYAEQAASEFGHAAAADIDTAMEEPAVAELIKNNPGTKLSHLEDSICDTYFNSASVADITWDRSGDMMAEVARAFKVEIPRWDDRTYPILRRCMLEELQRRLKHLDFSGYIKWSDVECKLHRYYATRRSTCLCGTYQILEYGRICPSCDSVLNLMIGDKVVINGVDHYATVNKIDEEFIELEGDSGSRWTIMRDDMSLGKTRLSHERRDAILTIELNNPNWN